jgi:hypothetical protein
MRGAFFCQGGVFRERRARNFRQSLAPLDLFAASLLLRSAFCDASPAFCGMML